MKAKILGLLLIALCGTVAMTQEASRADSWRGTSLTDSNSDTTARPQHHATAPPFCRGKSCLYYAGDFDWNNQQANGLCDTNSGSTVDCWTWVGVKPTHNALVTGATFAVIASNSLLGSTKTPFQVRVGITPGHAGKLVCNTSGSATLKLYGQSDGPPLFALTVNKFKKPCAMKKGKIYFINLQPQWPDGSGVAYVMDEEDVPPLNHQGWKTVQDDSYFNSPTIGIHYAPTWGSGGSCGGVGCDAFSVALTGTQD
jgi:hypothetical protein